MLSETMREIEDALSESALEAFRGILMGAGTKDFPARRAALRRELVRLEAADGVTLPGEPAVVNLSMEACELIAILLRGLD